MFLSAGQTSDYIGARALLTTIPPTEALLADRGYDADWFRNALIELGISPCIPSRTSRKVQIPHDAALYRLRHKIENKFARLKDWRRIAIPSGEAFGLTSQGPGHGAGAPPGLWPARWAVSAVLRSELLPENRTVTEATM
jgi:transposase